MERNWDSQSELTEGAERETDRDGQSKRNIDMEKKKGRNRT